MLLYLCIDFLFLRQLRHMHNAWMWDIGEEWVVVDSFWTSNISKTKLITIWCVDRQFAEPPSAGSAHNILQCNVDRAEQGEAQGKRGPQINKQNCCPQGLTERILYMEHNRTELWRYAAVLENWQLCSRVSTLPFCQLFEMNCFCFPFSVLRAPVPVPRCVPAAGHAENYIIRKMKLVTCQGRRLLELPRPLTDCFASHNWTECGGRARDTQPNQLTWPENVRVVALFH